MRVFAENLPEKCNFVGEAKYRHFLPQSRIRLQAESNAGWSRSDQAGHGSQRHMSRSRIQTRPAHRMRGFKPNFKAIQVMAYSQLTWLSWHRRQQSVTQKSMSRHQQLWSSRWTVEFCKEHWHPPTFFRWSSFQHRNEEHCQEKKPLNQIPINLLLQYLRT